MRGVGHSLPRYLVHLFFLRLFSSQSFTAPSGWIPKPIRFMELCEERGKGEGDARLKAHIRSGAKSTDCLWFNVTSPCLKPSKPIYWRECQLKRLQCINFASKFQDSLEMYGWEMPKGFVILGRFVIIGILSNFLKCVSVFIIGSCVSSGTKRNTFWEGIV